MTSAVVGYIHPGTVRAEFMKSMLELQSRSKTPIEAFMALQSGPNIVRARNKLVRQFMEDQSAPWLLMIDTDMVFAPDSLDRLIYSANRKTRPIVGGLCYSQGGGDDMLEQYTTMYELMEREGGPKFVRYVEWQENAMKRVSATGTGFLMVHRDAFDRILRHKPDPVCPWFKETVLGDSLVGEDMTFCLRAGAAGVPIYVHTGVQVGHMKSTMLGKVV